MAIAGDIPTLINEASPGVEGSGLIQGGTTGVTAPYIGRLENSGRIIGQTGDGVTLNAASGSVSRTATVENSGTIQGQTHGLNYGIHAISNLQNSGAIMGTNESGVSFTGTTNPVTVTNSGTIQGGTYGLDYRTNAIVSLQNTTKTSAIRGGRNEALRTLSLTTLNNEGTIASNSAAAITLTGTASGRVTIANSGTIQGGTYGLDYGNNAIASLQNNNGTIQGGTRAALSASTLAILNNSGTIASTSAAAITLTGNTTQAATIANTGTIRGATYGLDYGNNAIASLQNNNGTIQGGSNAALRAGTLLRLENSGTILSDRASAIVLTGTATRAADISNSGTIQGGAHGLNYGRNAIGELQNNNGRIVGGSGNAVTAGSITTLSNSGQIRAGATGIASSGDIATLRNTADSTVEGSGTITGGTAGITAGFIDSLQNTGTITGTGAGGVTLNASASRSRNDRFSASMSRTATLLDNSGRITGQTHGVDYGLHTLTRLNNSGTLQGGSAAALIAGSLTALSNSGTIASTSAGGITLTGSSDQAATVTNSGTIQGGTHGLNYGTNAISELQNNDGTIQGGSAAALTAGSLTALSNSGTIASTSAGGITLTGSSDQAATVTNSGTIQGGTHGLNYGTNAISELQNNNGTIQGGSAAALIAGSLTTLSNSGTIASTSAGGITLTGNSDQAATVTNSGTIQGGTHGVDYGLNALTRLSNSGTLRGAAGIALRASNITTLSNTGTIEGTTGIRLERRSDATGGSRIEHSGLLRSLQGPGGTALELRGTGRDALVLRTGARLEGELRWDGDGDTLHYADSASAQLTFFDNDAPAGRAPTAFAVEAPAQRLVLRSTATSSEFGRARTTLIFLDPSLYTLGENALSRWTGAVAEIIAQQSRTVPARPAGASGDRGQTLWLRPFGGAQRFARDGLRPAARHRYQGALLGYSRAGGGWLPGAAPRFGLFVGAVNADIDVRGLARDRHSDHLLAGAYLHSNWRTLHWHAALTIGESRYRSAWQRKNNLAPGGTEALRTNYKSRLLSAQLGFSGRLKLWGVALRPAVQARYLAQFTKDHDYRAGAATAIALRQRDVHIGLLSAQLAMPLMLAANDRNAWQGNVRLGVEGRTRLGGRLQRGLFDGQPLAFKVDGAEAAAGFLGAGLNYTVPALKLTFSANLETRYDTDDAFTVRGQLGIVWGF